MTPPPKPVRLTVDDYLETRVTGTHMRWPLDAETTARLRRVIGGGERQVAWWRRLLRRLQKLGKLA
jgi:hypothetical protein